MQPPVLKLRLGHQERRRPNILTGLELLARTSEQPAQLDAHVRREVPP
jgi:hypothetical protein